MRGKSPALSAIEDKFSCKLKSWSSNLQERDFCDTGSERRDSTLTALCCETKLLIKRPLLLETGDEINADKSPDEQFFLYSSNCGRPLQFTVDFI